MDHFHSMAKSSSNPSMAEQRPTRTSASGNNLSSLSSQTASAAAGAFADLLSDMPRSNSRSMRPAAAAKQPSPAPAQTAFKPSSTAAMAPLAAAAPVVPAVPTAASAMDDDPFAMFGTPPPPSMGSSFSMLTQGADGSGRPSPAAVADIDDGFLAAFVAPQRQQPPPQQQAPGPVATGGNLLSGDFDNFLDGFQDQPNRAPAAGAAAAAATAPAPLGRPPSRTAATKSTAAAPMAAAAASSDSLFQPLGSGPVAAAAARPAAGAAAGPTSSFGYEQPPAASAQPRYKVFDFVEPQHNSPTAAAAAGVPARRPDSQGSGDLRRQHPGRSSAGSSSAGSGSLHGSDAYQRQHRPASAAGAAAGAAAPTATGMGMLHADAHQQHQNQQQQGPKEVVSEMGQKAAKALHSGTKWFMRASKTLVSQVQQRLEQGAGGSPRAAAGQQAGGLSEAATFHYDWAAQLARISPGSRTAALGAMAEHDRLAVQRILDESTMGDSYMESPHYEGYADAPGSQKQQQQGGEQRQQQDWGHAPEASAFGGMSYGGSSSNGSQRTSSIPAVAADEDWGPAAVPAAVSVAVPAPARAAPPPPSYDQLFGDTVAQPAQQEQQTHPAAPDVAATAAAAVVEDLLGMSSTAAPASSRRDSAAAAAAAAVAADDDLLGFDGPAAGVAASKAAAGSGSSCSSNMASQPSGTSHIDDLFTVPAKPHPAAGGSAAQRPRAAPPSASAQPGGAAAADASRAAARAGSSRPSALDSMIDLGAGLPAADTAGFSQLYQDAEDAVGDGDGSEPEERRVLRQRRIQEKHERMMRQLAEKRARDEFEDAEKSGKVEFRSMLKPKIDGWAAGKKDNIRALLSSLHTVLWQDSGWVQPNLADMMENNKVKRVYMKANLVVHPDKVKQKGGSLEQVATADMVFDVLKAAWGKFEAANK